MKQLSTLHILNGDDSIPAFEAANLNGEILIWREILSEGPVITSIPEENFWEKREEFISKTYNENPEAYRHKVLSELNKLQQAHAFFEVVLWFDTDLMCQINLLYLLNFLNQSKPAIVSICHPKQNQVIAKLSPELIRKTFEARIQQTEEQLIQASELWQLYGNPDPTLLQQYLYQNHIKHPYLTEALTFHLKRYPNCKSGLSEPEEIVLNLIANGADNTKQLIEEFLNYDKGYGFGDLQILSILERLQPDLIQEREPLHLSFFGERVLEGRASFTPKVRWLGGSCIEPGNYSCYDALTGKLAKIRSKK